MEVDNHHWLVILTKLIIDKPRLKWTAFAWLEHRLIELRESQMMESNNRIWITDNKLIAQIRCHKHLQWAQQHLLEEPLLRPMFPVWRIHLFIQPILSQHFTNSLAMHSILLIIRESKMHMRTCSVGLWARDKMVHSNIFLWLSSNNLYWADLELQKMMLVVYHLILRNKMSRFKGTSCHHLITDSIREIRAPKTNHQAKILSWWPQINVLRRARMILKSQMLLEKSTPILFKVSNFKIIKREFVRLTVVKRQMISSLMTEVNWTTRKVIWIWCLPQNQNPIFKDQSSQLKMEFRTIKVLVKTNQFINFTSNKMTETFKESKEEIYSTIPLTVHQKTNLSSSILANKLNSSKTTSSSNTRQTINRTIKLIQCSNRIRTISPIRSWTRTSSEVGTMKDRINIYTNWLTGRFLKIIIIEVNLNKWLKMFVCTEVYAL